LQCRKKWKRKENLDTMDIDEVRKRKEIYKNYQMCEDKDFEDKVT